MSIKSSLQRLAPLTHNKVFPELTCVMIQAEGETMTLEASNFEQSMRITLPYAGKPVSCLVPHRKLVSMPLDDSTVFEMKGDLLHVSTGSYSAKLSTLPVSEWKGYKWLDSEATEIQACGDDIRWVSKATSNEMNSDQAFMGVTINGSQVIATDRKRFHLTHIEANIPETRIPLECIDTVASMLDVPCKLRKSDTIMQLESGDAVFATRLLGDEYADCQKVIDMASRVGDLWEFDADVLHSTIKTMSPLWSENESKRVEIHGRGNQISVQCFNGKDSMEACIDGSGAGSIAWHGTMLMDLLSGFEGKVILKQQEALISVSKDEVPWEHGSVAIASTYRIMP